jgi:hypothetical protein
MILAIFQLLISKLLTFSSLNLELFNFPSHLPTFQTSSELLMLSTDCQKKSAQRSGHFVWVDRPEIITQAVKELLDKLK